MLFTAGMRTFFSLMIWILCKEMNLYIYNKYMISGSWKVQSGFLSFRPYQLVLTRPPSKWGYKKLRRDNEGEGSSEH